VVYFLEPTGGGPIKIGFSHDVPKRIKELKSHFGTPLTLLATIEGGREREREIHARFAHMRLGKTEQFRPAPELLEFIGRPLLVGVNPDTVEAMPRSALTCAYQFSFTDEEMDMIDRLRSVISPDVPVTRTAVLRLALSELAGRRLGRK
jgi:hypothetical protein